MHPKKLVGDCKDCKQWKSQKPHLADLNNEEVWQMEGDDGYDSEDEEDHPADWCLQQMLSLQDDFSHEKSVLKKVSIGPQW